MTKPASENAGGTVGDADGTTMALGPKEFGSLPNEPGKLTKPWGLIVDFKDLCKNSDGQTIRFSVLMQFDLHEC